MLRTLLVAMLLMASAGIARAADQRDVEDVLERYRSARPRAEDLRVYQLDWALTFHEAKERAAREQRPIFLVVVTNSYGNIYTGHC